MPTDEQLACFFDQIPDDDLKALAEDLAAAPEIQQALSSIPESLQTSMAGATDEFLHGYLLGSHHASSALSAMMQAASKNDAATAATIRLRLNLVTLLLCRRLTGETPSIILTGVH